MFMRSLEGSLATVRQARKREPAKWLREVDVPEEGILDQAAKPVHTRGAQPGQLQQRKRDWRAVCDMTIVRIELGAQAVKLLVAM